MESVSKYRVWSVTSPDGAIQIKMTLWASGTLTYCVLNDGIIVIDHSTLGLSTSVADFTDGLTYLSHSTRAVMEKYNIITGKTSRVVNKYHELTVKFKKKIYEVHMIFRAYDDGVAYRYYVPGEGPISVYADASTFRISKEATAWAHDFVEHYEGFYRSRELTDLPEAHYGMPVLLHFRNAWALISEAAVYGQAGASHLSASSENSEVLLKIESAPDQSSAILSERPYETAWRAIIVANKLAGIVESNLIENLNPESEISDTTWIRPGRSAWCWWSGESTGDLDVQKKYVDFAARMGWEYYLCDGGWLEEWLPPLIDFANARGVRLFVWSHHQDLKTDDEIETKLSRWATMGVAGVKVDFFESDSQDKIRLYDKLAVETARRHLMLNYHGCTKPSGERRRWPHLVTREGVYGAEYYKFSDGPTAEHNCTLPFTRNVVGPMDYTPVTYSNNNAQTTYAHQTALCIIFESGVQHYADCVDVYGKLDDQVLELFRACPASWDETKLLEGFPGHYVTIARRKGDQWFIGAISAESESRTVIIPLTYMLEGGGMARVIRDGGVGDQLICEKLTVNKSMCVDVPLLANGGCSIWVVPK